MGKKKQTERLTEMRRLYEKEGKNLRQVAEHFGVSWQAIHERFVKNGIKLRPKKPTVKVLDRDVLVRLYIDEKLSLAEIECRLKTTSPILSREFKRHSIEKRSSGLFKRKYPELNQLEVGKIITVPRPTVTQPFRSLYQKAKQAGIKISIKSLDEKTFQITRVK